MVVNSPRAAFSPRTSSIHGPISVIDASVRFNLAYRPGSVARHPAILMLGSVPTNQVPDWSTNLVNEGYMLVAFSAAHLPDPDPARRPQWLCFDQRFAHSY